MQFKLLDHSIDGITPLSGLGQFLVCRGLLVQVGKHGLELVNELDQCGSGDGRVKESIDLLGRPGGGGPLFHV